MTASRPLCRGIFYKRLALTDETPNVHRGFCSQCGSSLFWDPRGKPRISIAASALDAPTDLETTGHVWVSQKGDYYDIMDCLIQHDQRFARADK